MDKFIIHCDMDNYFASVETLYNPYLKEVPMVVTGDVNMHHGIILSKNNKAKEFNICTGESLFSAKNKCPMLVAVNSDYHRYLKYTKLSREIYHRYTDKVYPYGMDEAWLDVSDSIHNLTEATTLAKRIKKEIKDELGLAVSIGVSFNYVFSKLGSDMKLVDDVFVVGQDDYLEITKNMPAFNLLFIGNKTRSALRKMNILTIGDLRQADVNILKHKFGKTGQVIYDFAYGNDSWFNPVAQDDKDIKSIGNTITAIKDIEDTIDLEAYMYILTNILVKRLKKHNLQGKSVCLSFKYNDFTRFSRQMTSDSLFNTQKRAYELVYLIYSKVEIEKPIRSITIRINNLCYAGGEQLSLFDNDDFMVDNEVEKIIKRLKSKYGDILVEKSSTLGDLEG